MKAYFKVSWMSYHRSFILTFLSLSAGMQYNKKVESKPVSDMQIVIVFWWFNSVTLNKKI